MTCPHCHAQISRPLKEGGGILVQTKGTIRLLTKGTIAIGCPKCGSELQTTSDRVKFVLIKAGRREGTSGG